MYASAGCRHVSKDGYGGRDLSAGFHHSGPHIPSCGLLSEHHAHEEGREHHQGKDFSSPARSPSSAYGRIGALDSWQPLCAFLQFAIFVFPASVLVIENCAMIAPCGQYFSSGSRPRQPIISFFCMGALLLNLFLEEFIYSGSDGGDAARN